MTQLRGSLFWAVHRPSKPVGKAKREDIIRIEMFDRPDRIQVGEGSFEIRYMDDRYFVDSKGVLDKIAEYFPDVNEQIFDRLWNFRKIFLNITTGEIST